MGEAEAALIETEAEHRKELEEVEGALDAVRKREARLVWDALSLFDGIFCWRF